MKLETEQFKIFGKEKLVVLEKFTATQTTSRNKQQKSSNNLNSHPEETEKE